jgi:cobalt-zinc-cadmium efflux system outer membrane protein
VRYVREAGAATFVAGFGVPIPVFDRNQGAAKAAGMRINRAEAEQSARALELTTRLSVLHETLLAANAEAGALRDRAIPEAVAAFRAARDGYLRGAMRFTDVLDTERLLFELNVRYLDALVRCRSTVADIERLTGAPLRTPIDDERRVSP